MVKFGAENRPVKPAELPFIIKSGEASPWSFVATLISISENNNLYFFTSETALSSVLLLMVICSGFSSMILYKMLSDAAPAPIIIIF